MKRIPTRFNDTPDRKFRCRCGFSHITDNDGAAIPGGAAKQSGITMTVTAAVKESECVGIIQSHSPGAKGTYIKTENRFPKSGLEKYTGS